VVERRSQQRQVLGLLLAATALIIPVSGAALYSGTSFAGGNALVLGAVGVYDTVPVLMLLGALALVVVSGPGPNARVATITVGLVLAASAVLTVGYLGTAYELRPDGPFDVAGDGSSMTGWSGGRLSTIVSLGVIGLLCTTAFGYGVRWMAGRKETVR